MKVPLEKPGEREDIKIKKKGAQILKYLIQKICMESIKRLGIQCSGCVGYFDFCAEIAIRMINNVVPANDDISNERGLVLKFAL